MIRKAGAGGGWGCTIQAQCEKQEGCVCAVHFRHDTKGGGGGGGGGCLAEEGEVPYMKGQGGGGGGVATPPPYPSLNTSEHINNAPPSLAPFVGVGPSFR